MAQTNFMRFFNDRGQDANFVPSVLPDQQSRISSTIILNGNGGDSGTLSVSVVDAINGTVTIGSCGVSSSDTIETAATNLANSITDYGYSAVSYRNIITVYAPLGYGSDMIGLNLTIEFN